MQTTMISRFSYYLRQRGYVFIAVCVSVRDCVCVQNISKSYERILMKFSEEGRGCVFEAYRAIC